MKITTNMQTGKPKTKQRQMPFQMYINANFLKSYQSRVLDLTLKRLKC